MLHLDYKTECFDFSQRRFTTGLSLQSAGCHRLEKDGAFTLPIPDNGVALVAVLLGKLETEIGEELDASFAVLLKNDSGIVRPKKGVPECEFVFASICGDGADSIVRELPESVFSPFFLRQDAQLLSRLCSLVSDAQHKLIMDAYSGAQQAYSLLMELCRRFDADEGEAYPELVSHAIAIIKEEYQYLFGVEELSSMLEVSKHHLIRLFAKHVGLSPGKFLTQTRIDNAKHLLKDREYSVEIVGQFVGYANGNYFCKAFRAQTGMSPGEYRSKYC